MRLSCILILFKFRTLEAFYQYHHIHVSKVAFKKGYSNYEDLRQRSLSVSRGRKIFFQCMNDLKNSESKSNIDVVQDIDYDKIGKNESISENSPPISIISKNLKELSESSTAGRITKDQKHFSGNNNNVTENLSIIFDSAEARNVTATNDQKRSENNTVSKEADISPKEEVGIGGKDGYIYDVNKVKRNLVQEAQREYKRELLQLLSHRNRKNIDENENNEIDSLLHESSLVSETSFIPTIDELIEEKLSVLVMINPVSTTTDSNLLDGTWDFVYKANNAKSVLDTSTIRLNPAFTFEEYSSAKSGGGSSSINEMNLNSDVGKNPPFLLKRGNLFTKLRRSRFFTRSRTIFLENVQADDDPFVIDQIQCLRGLFIRKIFYKVTRLTRTTLFLEKLQVTKSFLNNRLTFFSPKSSRKEEIENPIVMQHILYVDSDLYISTDDKDMEGPLYVYTKSEMWKQRDPKKRNLMPSWLFSKMNLQNLKRVDKAKPSSYNSKKSSLEQLTDINNKRLLAIGEVYPDRDEETSAWNIDEDPFYHLDVDNKRIQMIKDLSIEEIEAAGKYHKQRNKKLKIERFKQPKKFKKPNNKE